MINLSHYYRTAFLLPLVLPLVAIALHDYSPLFVFVSLSLVFGGIGYLLFYTLAFFVLGQATTDLQKRKFVRWTPVLFIPFQFIGYHLTHIGIELADPTPEITSIGSSLSVLPFWALFVLLFGYSYILLIESARVLIFKVRIEEHSNIPIGSDA